MYYGAYFAASALLGMFGAWKAKGHNVVVDVARGATGSLEFRARAATFMANTSHKMFWEFFYAEVPALIPWVNPAVAFSLAPVSGDPYWMTNTRNDINYDSFLSVSAIHSFQGGFKASTFPASLPGALNTQYQVLEGLLTIAAAFAKDFKLETDALQTIATEAKRRQRSRTLVFMAKPASLGRRAKQKVALG